jgi:hypothetical protein
VRSLLKSLALGGLLVWSLAPLEAKAAAVSLLTGRPVSASLALDDDDDTIGRAQIASHRRPARLARAACAAPVAAAARGGRGVPLPALRASYRRAAVLLAAVLEGHALDLGRERAPPA